jgi:hypothetical protein
VTAIKDGAFKLGETWLILGTIRDYAGGAIDLTGATVKLRIGTTEQLLFDLETPAGGSITDAATGKYSFSISSAQQQLAGVQANKKYAYEVYAVLADATSTSQNEGFISVKPSRFSF